MNSSAEWFDTCAGVLGGDGLFFHRHPGFSPRAVQQEMAAAVAEAIDARQKLMVEAGTGTGKTYAYLVPALLAAKRVVISTGTKALQDQLHNRDLPRVQEILSSPVRTALLKGRSNYLCLYRLDRLRQTRQGASIPEVTELLEWSQATRSGEIADFGELEASLAQRVTSTPDNCLGAKCPVFDHCFVVRARRSAQAAEVIVVNHHLLLSDFRLKEEGFGVLPAVDAVIVDEAHQLPELASQFFGEHLSTRQLTELARDSGNECSALGDMPGMALAAQDLADCVYKAEMLFGQIGAREAWKQFSSRRGVQKLHEQLGTALSALAGTLRDVSIRSAELEGLSARAQLVEARWRLLSATEAPTGWVRWIEPSGRGGFWRATTMETAEPFRRLFEAYPGSWVFTSATLSALSDFEDFRSSLGLSEARGLRLASPFDFSEQARLYIPSGLPDPSQPDYCDAVVAALTPILAASTGGALILCTSHQAVVRVADLLRCQKKPLYGQVMAQNDASKSALLEQFATAGDAVLVATNSFWEGIDVKGSALRVVAIDKVPFTVPGDPLHEARMAAIRAGGGRPFLDYQLPRAMLALRQGIGRLIRDAGDRGLVVLCDPRLLTRAYGHRILVSMPPMARLDGEDAACAWVGRVKAS